METLAAIGFIAICAACIYFLISMERKKEDKINHYKELLSCNSDLRNDFNSFRASHDGMNYENALRIFFADNERLNEAVQYKQHSDYIHYLSEESVKKSITIMRVFGYQYEEFLFSLYSPLAQKSNYDSSIWDMPYDALLPEYYIIDKMKEVGYSNVHELFQDFLKNELLSRDRATHQYTIGTTLTLYANYLSKEDNNIDKWIKKHGQSSTKEELMRDITRKMDTRNSFS